ncbi:hypothetical protein L9G74_19250 [Shewanella sp. C32]|uniref:Uncharacterized protein n=1 Tax=Shewanella electrica TaxID=515560 RepID=A0ABT2FQR2_9GAMM|nr:hypothetical protein [Shewanella electrica]MCH1926957.1 hypothetical protein [Shewanella electrica]MCS4558578.1 hypothetical protein [Shewanella electrica]
MKINENSNIAFTQKTKIDSQNQTGAISFANIMSKEMEKSQQPTADFTNMTRKDLFDWMNSQIHSGKMTLDEGIPYLGMIMSNDALTGAPIDMATDTTRFNFVAKAQAGWEGANARNDMRSAQQLQSAIETMLSARAKG